MRPAAGMPRTIPLFMDPSLRRLARSPDRFAKGRMRTARSGRDGAPPGSGEGSSRERATPLRAEEHPLQVLALRERAPSRVDRLDPELVVHAAQERLAVVGGRERARAGTALHV